MGNGNTFGCSCSPGSINGIGDIVMGNPGLIYRQVVRTEVPDFSPFLIQVYAATGKFSEFISEIPECDQQFCITILKNE